jgi:hypothetical protein
MATQRQIRYYMLQLAVLVPVVSAFRLATIHTAILRLPAIVGLLADPVLPA